MNKLLFLDFDGVMHPNFSQGQEYFSRADLLVEALNGHANGLNIVISSSWRFHFSFEAILNRFPQQLRDLVAGATPEVEPGRHQRYREILAYLKQYSVIADWRALDDDIAGFPLDCRQLITCDGLVGLDSKSALRLRHWIINAT
jgi:hypothetical protein